jgi:hypothetical protein
VIAFATTSIHFGCCPGAVVLLLDKGQPHSIKPGD